MPFTGQIGTANSMPGNIVPMFGAGGTRRSQSLNGNLTSVGVISSIHTFVFSQTSITVYRAVSRIRNFITVLRTSI